MKTTHQLAAELMLLPDLRLVVEGWIDGDDPTPKITDWSDDVAILVVERNARRCSICEGGNPWHDGPHSFS